MEQRRILDHEAHCFPPLTNATQLPWLSALPFAFVSSFSSGGKGIQDGSKDLKYRFMVSLRDSAIGNARLMVVKEAGVKGRVAGRLRLLLPTCRG